MLLVAYVLLRDASVVNTRAAQQTVQGTENWISCQTHDECGAMEEELHFLCLCEDETCDRVASCPAGRRRKFLQAPGLCPARGFFGDVRRL